MRYITMLLSQTRTSAATMVRTRVWSLLSLVCSYYPALLTSTSGTSGRAPAEPPPNPAATPAGPAAPACTRAGPCSTRCCCYHHGSVSESCDTLENYYYAPHSAAN